MTRANDIATMIKDGRFIDYTRIPALLITEHPTIVAGSSTATLSAEHDIAKLEVYLNGVLLKQTTEYTISGTTLTLAGGEVFSSGDILTIKVFKADANNVDLAFASSSDVNISNIADGELLKFDSATSKVIPTSLVENGNGNLNLRADSTESRYIRIGDGRTGNGYSYIDLVGDNVNTYGLRLIRNNDGENAASILRHEGTGNFRFRGADASAMLFETDGTERMRIDASGNVGIGTASPAFNLDVDGGSLGSTSGDKVEAFRLQIIAGTNYDLLNFTKIREANGPDWTTAGWRIQQKIDGIDMAYLQFNGDGLDRGLSLGTNNAERMRITSDGNVGIGTTSPGSKLHVNGTTTLQGNVYLNRTTQLENYDVSAAGHIGTTGSIIAGEGSGAVALSINDGYGNANISFNHHAGTPDVTGNSFRIETNVDYTTNAFMVFEGKSTTTAGAGVGLNMMATMYADTGNMTIGGALTQNSDLRIKRDLQIIPDALDKVKTLNGYTYTRTDRDSEFQQTGCVAQEVQAVLPEAVVTGEDEQQTLSIAYGSMVGLLVQAIKELEAKVAALESGGA